MPRVPLIVSVAVAVLLAVFAAPIKQRCGAPGLSCASALDNAGNIHYYFEVEPVGVYLAEIVIGTNIPLFYTSGEDVVRANSRQWRFAGQGDAATGRRVVSNR